MRINIGKPFMLILASLMMVGGFSAKVGGEPLTYTFVGAAKCTKASLKGRWYVQEMRVRVGPGFEDSDGMALKIQAQRTIPSKTQGSLLFTGQGKVTLSAVSKTIDLKSESTTKSEEGTYVVSKSCIATLTFPGDIGQDDNIVKLQVFPLKGLFTILESNDGPSEVSLGFGIKLD